MHHLSCCIGFRSKLYSRDRLFRLNVWLQVRSAKNTCPFSVSQSVCSSRIHCCLLISFTGNPPPQFTWTLDGFAVRLFYDRFNASNERNVHTAHNVPFGKRKTNNTHTPNVCKFVT